jgi:HAMP domain-containing protein
MQETSDQLKRLATFFEQGKVAIVINKLYVLTFSLCSLSNLPSDEINWSEAVFTECVQDTKATLQSLTIPVEQYGINLNV